LTSSRIAALPYDIVISSAVPALGTLYGLV
jgi:hypothetical protein